MSGEATGYVWRYSTARGATLTVHLAIADVANDAHDNRFWVPITAIAKKARVSRSTAMLSITWLVDNGYLERLSTNGNPGQSGPVEYRFLMTEGVRPSDTPPVRPSDTPLSDHRTPPVRPSDKQKQVLELNKRNMNAIVAGFEKFWAIYPRRTGGEKAASRAFHSAVRDGTDPAAIVDGARRFATDPNLPEMQYVPHAKTWLNAGRWADPPLPPRVSNNGQRVDADPSYWQ